MRLLREEAYQNIEISEETNKTHQRIEAVKNELIPGQVSR